MSVHIVGPFSKMKMTVSPNYHQEVLQEGHLEGVLQEDRPEEVHQEVHPEAVHQAVHPEAVHPEAVHQAVHPEAVLLEAQVDPRLHHPNRVVPQEVLQEVRLKVLVVFHLPAGQKVALQRVLDVDLQNE